MVDMHCHEDVESGNLPCGSDSPVIFEFERSNPGAPVNRPKSARGWIAVILVGCIIVAILSLLVWGIASYASPSSNSQSSTVQAAPAKVTFSRDIPYSTTNMSITSSIANSSTHNSTFSRIDGANGTNHIPLDARGLPPPAVTCETKYDCDWNQLCSDGICKSGCESNNDCRRPQNCKQGWCHYKGLFCRKMPCLEKCIVNLHNCQKDKECCSNMCRRSSRDRKVKVCQSGSRQKRKDVEDESEAEDIE